MLGKVLQGRYQIIQLLSAGLFRQTYVAEDIQLPGKPKCVVKHFQFEVGNQTLRSWETFRHRFSVETETLQHLGHHQQIPQLLACFEDHQELYLVREFIEGQSLSAELAISKHQGRHWTQEQCIELLQEILPILQFIHSRGIIHCNIKPNNLIRRAADGKLFLIDFDTVQPVSLDSPRTDIYALGMMIIQILTRWEPLQLKPDPQTNQVICQYQVQISEQLASVLTQMALAEGESCYQSASQVLQDIETLQIGSEALKKTSAKSFYFPKSPSLTTVLGMGLAANAVVISVGLYSLLHAQQPEPEKDVLIKAQKQYQTGDINQAIATAKTITANSPVYPEVETAIREWRREWTMAETQFQAARQAFHEGRWQDVINATRQTPDISYWQNKILPFSQQSKLFIKADEQELLQKAYKCARDKDFTSALVYLKQIPLETALSNEVQAKLIEYTEKQHIRAIYLLQQAYEHAENKDFQAAIDFLKEIPEGTSVYAKAQEKIDNYIQKQEILAKSAIETISINPITLKQKKSSRYRTSKLSFSDLNPGSNLQEILPNQILLKPQNQTNS